MHDLRVTYNVLILGNHMPQNSSKFDFTCHHVLTEIAFRGDMFHSWKPRDPPHHGCQLGFGSFTTSFTAPRVEIP